MRFAPKVRAGKCVGVAFAGSFARGLPPHGIDFLLFQMSWRPRFPFTRLVSIMKGERSMSIGR